MPYTVIDLVTDPNQHDRLTRFRSVVNELCQSDPLYSNYANLTVSDFICLTAVLENNEIIALSGVQYLPERWGENTVRMSTRFWVHPTYRINSLSKFKHDYRLYFNSQLMIPFQLEFIKLLGISFAIITREGEYRRSFGKFIDLVNHHNNTKFTILDRLYNVCQPMECVPDSCKQIIAVYNLNTLSFNDELTELSKQGKLSAIEK
jgi:hypothetical protein